MSDMKKWLKLVESVHPVVATPPVGKSLSRDTTVVLGPQVGGGVGRFVEFTAEGAALIDVKGVIKEFASNEYAVPERDMQNGNDWFHMSVLPGTPGTQNDKPEFRPGDMIKIADVYGSVIGPGFGVFVGYGTTGQDCVVLFDGKQLVVPIENVASVLEQEAKDNFNDMDNDGNLSPMSFGSENVKIEQEPAMDHRDEFTKWMEAVEEALKSEGKELEEDIPPMMNGCGCGSWDCPTCFPHQDEVPGMHGSMDGLGGVNPAPGCGMTANLPVVDAGMPEVCAACGHALDDGHMHEPNVVSGGRDFGLEEISNFDDQMDSEELMQAPMEEEPQIPQKSESLPRSSDGRGVKLGDIVQKTEYRKVGQESPLTHGGELEESLDYDKVLNAVASLAKNSFGKTDDEIWNSDWMGEWAQTIEDANPSEQELDFIIKTGTMPPRLSNLEFNVGDSFQFGEGMLEAGYENDDDDDFSDLGHYEPRGHEMSGYSKDPYMDDPIGKKEYDDEMAGGPKTEKDVEDALDMISIIKQMQMDGSTQASKNYSEFELANTTLPQLRQIYAEVTGNTGVINMENIDPDVAAMLKTLQSYDKMVAESNKKPDFLDVDKDGDKKEPWKKAEKEKAEPKKEEVKESKDVDPEVLEWMARLAKVAR